ncbi:hypothetical protein [Streptomyces sp. NK08204]|uniref:hypothetical protein n=1 Tax=Streptomyces sp. NK08204 TaxID=2873260 RepID=UPI001CEDD990|nr:hypothetical protein [Streptomyces sp. NK08204]
MTAGDSYHYGDQVNVHGSHNIGMIKYQSADAHQQIGQLVDLVTRLRGQVPEAAVQVIDENLPLLADGTRTPQDRYRALIALSTIAQTVGEVGRPVTEAVRRVLQLLGFG